MRHSRKFPKVWVGLWSSTSTGAAGAGVGGGGGGGEAMWEEKPFADTAPEAPRGEGEGRRNS